jgi:hypothetical protein
LRYETRPFDQTLHNLSKESVAHQGLYHFQIEKYLERFHREQMLIISFDRIKSDITTVISDIYDFLGISKNINIERLEKIHNANSNIVLKRGFGLTLMRFYHQYIEQRPLPYRFKKLFLAASNIGGKAISKPVLTASEKQLLDDFYRQDSALLTRDFGIPTSHWYE